MRNLYLSFLRWFTVTRHISALAKSGYAVVPFRHMQAHLSAVSSLATWIEVSGAMNDGTVPNNTKKTVEFHCEKIAKTFPERVVQ